ncbi:MAG: glycosyltransferase [Bacteroidetes bacterium]|nr:MAG: glycosyltransferase [Bacteroidota bacterium]
MASSTPEKVVILGSAYPLRGGGMATFNERLCRAFLQQKIPCYIRTFSLQYPSFLFPGKTQLSTEAPPTDIAITVAVNSINPFNWLWQGYILYKQKPSLLVVRYWLPFMGPCLGTICRIAKWNGVTKIICIADNVIPHEKRLGDQLFTRYFMPSVQGFITMSEKVANDVRLFSQKPLQQVKHPLYDTFGVAVPKLQARQHIRLHPSKKIVLFFGFIRAYKGLDLLLHAIAHLAKQTPENPVELLVAGEFYEDETTYKNLAKELQIEHLVHWHSQFIADADVRYYLSAADFVIQPYKNATQSGVTPLAYHFEKPMLVTNVGALPAMVPPTVGLVTEPTATHIAEGIQQLYTTGEEYFIRHLQQEKKQYTWEALVNTLLLLKNQV